MAEVFKKSGVETRLARIESANRRDLDTTHALGIAFPVAGWYTYPFVQKFIESLPAVSGTPVFLAATMAGSCLGLMGGLRKLLEDKGYKPAGAKVFVMPSNLLIIEKDEVARKKVAKGLRRAERFARQILIGKAKWKRIPFLSDFSLVLGRKIWKLNWQMLGVDTSLCSRCRLCLKLCPVSNIRMGEYPEHQGRCEYCMRCISFCPNQAITFWKKHVKTYKAVKAEALLD